MASLTGCGNPCQTCAQIRQITGSTPLDIGLINENFKKLSEQYETLCMLVNQFLNKDSGIDADGFCITNVKDCKDDPNSVVPRAALKQLILDTVAAKNTCSGCHKPVTSCSCVYSYTTLLPNSE